MSKTECFHSATDSEGICLDCGALAAEVIASLRKRLAEPRRAVGGILEDAIRSLEQQIEIAVEALAWHAGMGDEKADAALKAMTEVAKRKGDTR